MSLFCLGHRCKKLFLVESCFKDDDGDVDMELERIPKMKHYTLEDKGLFKGGGI